MPRVPASVKRSAAMVAIALAVTGLAARAVALESHAPATASFTVQMAAAEPPGPAEPMTTEPFPPIRVEPLPYAPPVGASGGAGSTEQTLVLVISGGTMSVSPTSANVVLHRHGDHFVGQFGPITVVDARGSLVGWKLRASLSVPESGHLTVHPATAVAVTGRPGEATASGAAPLTMGGTVIMSAPPEGGGGDFSISGTVDLERGNNDGDTITVPLAFAVS